MGGAFRGTLGRAPAGFGLLSLFGIWSCESRAPAPTPQSQSTPSLLERGAYLVAYGGCNDCHTPKTMTPQEPAYLRTLKPVNNKVPPPIPPTGAAR